MKIAVVDLISVMGGGLQITRSLYDYISSGNAAGHEWLFIVSTQKYQENEYIKVLSFPRALDGYLSRAVTEIRDVSRALRDFGAQAVISMSNMRTHGCDIDQYVYVQQSIPFQTSKRFSFLLSQERYYAFRQYIQGFFIKHSIAKARAVLVQTNWMKKAIESSVPGVPVINIGYPVDIHVSEQNSAQALGHNFFYPCRPDIYKNYPVIVDAVQKLRAQGYFFKFYLTLSAEQFEELSGGKSIDWEVFECIGRIPAEEVKKKYAETTLVFTSYIESLGLPLVEARSAGTWIIASDCDFSHEVLDSYPNCAFFPHFDADRLADEMKKVLEDKVSLKEYDEAAVQQENCWHKLLSLLE